MAEMESNLNDLEQRSKGKIEEL